MRTPDAPAAAAPAPSSSSLLELYGAASHQSLVDWLFKEYGLAQDTATTSTNANLRRRLEMGERVRLYRDDYAKDMGVLIDQIWQMPDYREKLKAYLGVDQLGQANGHSVATQQNVSVRIVHEVASLYDKPALRILGNKAQQAAFKLDEKRLRLHEITQDYHRLLWLCNEVLVWQFMGVNGKTKLQVVTPDQFEAVPNPNDKTVMAGVLISVARPSMAAKDQQAKLPMWELWDETFHYLINGQGKIIAQSGELVDTPTAHGLGRIPGVLLHRREPSEKCLDPRPGRDIAAAHRAVCLMNILLMRLSKTQGERQPVLQGALANMAKNQTADGENPIVLPPEVTASMLDTVTDPGHLLKTKRECLVSIGQTYGVSYEQLTFEETGSTTGSAKSYQVRREKLAELRTEQRRRAQVNEGEVVELIGYDPTDLLVDHREQALPQDPTEAMALLDLRVRLGMDSPVKALMRENPDLSREDAIKLMEENFGDWALMITKARALNLPSNASAVNNGQDPQINGSGKITEKLDPGQLAQPGGMPAPTQQPTQQAPRARP